MKLNRLNIAWFIANRSLSTSIDFKVLEEVWMGKTVDYYALGVFKCPLYVHV